MALDIISHSWLGTSLRGQERSLEHSLRPYPATSRALRSDRRLMPGISQLSLELVLWRLFRIWNVSIWANYLDMSLMQHHMIIIRTQIVLPLGDTIQQQRTAIRSTWHFRGKNTRCRLNQD